MLCLFVARIKFEHPLKIGDRLRKLSREAAGIPAAHQGSTMGSIVLQKLVEGGDRLGVFLFMSEVMSLLLPGAQLPDSFGGVYREGGFDRLTMPHAKLARCMHIVIALVSHGEL